PELWSASGWALSPQRVLCCAGPLSFADLRAHRLFLPRYKVLDAIQHLAPPEPNTSQKWLLVHGQGDLTVKAAHSIKFHARLQALGYPAQLLLLDGGTHLDSGQWMFGGQWAQEIAHFIKGVNEPV
ncbi:MAG: prolyl oligopeptidase family serine peptidase, partial [Bacteroidota bacterium]